VGSVFNGGQSSQNEIDLTAAPVLTSAHTTIINSNTEFFVHISSIFPTINKRMELSIQEV
jgi:hypothetical protein